MDRNDLDRIVLMKVGAHAKEDLDGIIERKKAEESKVGFMFWGYGGSLCHPTKQVHIFAQESLQAGYPLTLVMTTTKSRLLNQGTIASHYSEDKETWSQIPKDLVVTGSKYALVCKNLTPVDFEIDLADYIVGVGPSRGRSLSEYIGDRVDKACAARTQSRGDTNSLNVCYVAELVPPFAVFLRNHV